MQCVRCNGLKVPEIMQDGGMRVLAYRCIHCGDVIDHTILLHRRHHDPRRSRSRTPIYQDTRWRREKSAVGELDSDLSAKHEANHFVTSPR
jgi:hypothetical protein